MKKAYRSRPGWLRDADRACARSSESKISNKKMEAAIEMCIAASLRMTFENHRSSREEGNRT